MARSAPSDHTQGLVFGKFSLKSACSPGRFRAKKMVRSRIVKVAHATMVLLTLLSLGTGFSTLAQTNFYDLGAPPHHYRQRKLTDRFSQLKEALETGKV